MGPIGGRSGHRPVHPSVTANDETFVAVPIDVLGLNLDAGASGRRFFDASHGSRTWPGQRSCRTGPLEITLLAGGEQRTSLGISDEVERLIEEAQFTHGPYIDAARLIVPVHEPDLAASGPARWPIFAPRAVAAGVAAISWPMR
ncbi:MAG: hypothetical protein LC792_18290 [Actinobacteria bacterium]|nr:hypothetical protein [Actinomycetota bacterium]